MLTKLLHFLGFGKVTNTTPPQPTAASFVPGFTVTLEKKPGVLFTTQQEGSPLRKPATMEHFYEITVTNDGTNPEYPDTRPWKAMFTTALNEDFGRWVIDHKACGPAGSNWLSFELREEYADDRKNGVMGRAMPPHHRLVVMGIHEPSGLFSKELSVTGPVRKSDRESPAWQLALKSPIHYM